MNQSAAASLSIRGLLVVTFLGAGVAVASDSVVLPESQVAVKPAIGAIVSSDGLTYVVGRSHATMLSADLQKAEPQTLRLKAVKRLGETTFAAVVESVVINRDHLLSQVADSRQLESVTINSVRVSGLGGSGVSGLGGSGVQGLGGSGISGLGGSGILGLGGSGVQGLGGSGVLGLGGSGILGLGGSGIQGLGGSGLQGLGGSGVQGLGGSGSN